MPQRVIITTGSRLHFGLLAHSPQAQRQFGGVGLMVDRPGFRVQAEIASSAEDVFDGPVEWKSRVLDVAQRCRELIAGPSFCRWTLSETILPHVGLGSGTQLALAVAQAYSALQGDAVLAATELAHRAGRGLRSALGIHGFQQGGFLVEVGKRSSDQISPAASRVDWPDEWQLLLVRPTDSKGLCGAEEIAAFSRLSPMAKALSARLCQITLLELLPAVLERDFDTCSEALYQFGSLVGEYFSPAQGGTYSTLQIRNLVQYVRQQGLHGVGQSSWGPTGFVMCPSPAIAQEIRTDLLTRQWGDCEITVASARNTGTTIETLC